MPTALVLGGTSAHIPLLQQLRQRGWQTLLLDYHERPVAATYADHHLRRSALDLAAVCEAARAHRAELVISACSDQLNAVACAAAQTLGLPAPYSPETALNVTDKRRMKALLDAHGIATAPWRCLRSLAELPALDLPLPVVVKPVDSCGSKGVRRVTQPAALPAALQAALDLSRAGAALVETFVPGREICLDGLVSQGRAQLISVYEKFNLYSPHTVIQCFRSVRPLPQALPPGLEARLPQLLQQIATAFGLHNTPLFVQTLLSAQGQLYVVELAARAPGGLAAQATQRATGVDLVALSLASFLGEPLQVNVQPTVGSISTQSLYARPGVLGQVQGAEALLQQGILSDFVPYLSPGMSLQPELSSRDRVAGLLIAAPDAATRLQRSDQALRALEVTHADGQPALLRAPFVGQPDAHLWLQDVF